MNRNIETLELKILEEFGPPIVAIVFILKFNYIVKNNSYTLNKSRRKCRVLKRPHDL